MQEEHQEGARGVDGGEGRAHPSPPPRLRLSCVGRRVKSETVWAAVSPRFNPFARRRCSVHRPSLSSRLKLSGLVDSALRMSPHVTEIVRAGRQSPVGAVD